MQLYKMNLCEEIDKIKSLKESLSSIPFHQKIKISKRIEDLERQRVYSQFEMDNFYTRYGKPFQMFYWTCNRTYKEYGYCDTKLVERHYNLRQTLDKLSELITLYESVLDSSKKVITMRVSIDPDIVEKYIRQNITLSSISTKLTELETKILNCRSKKKRDKLERKLQLNKSIYDEYERCYNFYYENSSDEIKVEFVNFLS